MSQISFHILQHVGNLVAGLEYTKNVRDKIKAFGLELAPKQAKDLQGSHGCKFGALNTVRNRCLTFSCQIYFESGSLAIVKGNVRKQEDIFFDRERLSELHV